MAYCSLKFCNHLTQPTERWGHNSKIICIGEWQLQKCGIRTELMRNKEREDELPKDKALINLMDDISKTIEKNRITLCQTRGKYIHGKRLLLSIMMRQLRCCIYTLSHSSALKNNKYIL